MVLLYCPGSKDSKKVQFEEVLMTFQDLRYFLDRNMDIHKDTIQTLLNLYWHSIIWWPTLTNDPPHPYF